MRMLVRPFSCETFIFASRPFTVSFHPLQERLWKMISYARFPGRSPVWPSGCRMVNTASFPQERSILVRTQIFSR